VTNSSFFHRHISTGVGGKKVVAAGKEAGPGRARRSFLQGSAAIVRVGAGRCIRGPSLAVEPVACRQRAPARLPALLDAQHAIIPGSCSRSVQWTAQAGQIKAPRSRTGGARGTSTVSFQYNTGAGVRRPLRCLDDLELGAVAVHR